MKCSASSFQRRQHLHSPKYAPLEAHRPAGNTGSSGVYTLTIPASVEQKDIPRNEAEQIARFIRSEVDANRRSFGNFLILTRKRKILGSYAEALETLHIPIEVSGAGASRSPLIRPARPTPIEILKGLRDRYEAHHRVQILDAALKPPSSCPTGTSPAAACRTRRSTCWMKPVPAFASAA